MLILEEADSAMGVELSVTVTPPLSASGKGERSSASGTVQSKAKIFPLQNNIYFFKNLPTL